MFIEDVMFQDGRECQHVSLKIHRCPLNDGFKVPKTTLVPCCGSTSTKYESLSINMLLKNLILSALDSQIS